MAYPNLVLTSSVALTTLLELRVVTSSLKAKTPMKSLLLRVLMTLLAAALAMVILFPDIEPEISMIKIIFLAPEVAITYHGRYLGS